MLSCYTLFTAAQHDSERGVSRSNAPLDEGGPGWLQDVWLCLLGRHGHRFTGRLLLVSVNQTVCLRCLPRVPPVTGCDVRWTPNNDRVYSRFVSIIDQIMSSKLSVQLLSASQIFGLKPQCTTCSVHSTREARQSCKVGMWCQQFISHVCMTPSVFWTCSSAVTTHWNKMTGWIWVSMVSGCKGDRSRFRWLSALVVSAVKRKGTGCNSGSRASSMMLWFEMEIVRFPVSVPGPVHPVQHQSLPHYL